MSSSEDKVAGIPFAGSPVSRSNFRNRKKEKFKRHLAALSSPTNNDATSDAEAAAATPNKSPTKSGYSATKSKPKSKSPAVVKARSPPAAFRSLQTKSTASDSKRSNQNNNNSNVKSSTSSLSINSSDDHSDNGGSRFPKRQIRYVATSPSEDSEIAISLPRRPIRSLMTNPSEDSVDSFVPTKSIVKTKDVAPTLPSIVRSPRHSTMKTKTFEDRSETVPSDDCSDASAPTEVNSNTTRRKTETEPSRGRSSSLRRRLLNRSKSSTDKASTDEGRSDVSIPFDEMMSRSIDLQTALVKTCEITSRKGESKFLASQSKKKTVAANASKPERRIRKSYSASLLPGVSSLRSFHSEDTKEDSKKAGDSSRVSSLKPSRSFASATIRSHSLPRGKDAVQTNAMEDEEKPVSKRSRSFSRGRKSRLVDKMVKKQIAILQDRKKEDPPELDDNVANLVADTVSLQQQAESQELTIQTYDSRDLAIGSIDETADSHSKDSVENAVDATAQIEVDNVVASGTANAESIDNLVEESTSRQEELSKMAELVHDNLVKHNEDYEQFDDPPLEEIESEVSVGFDMRSIHDALPLDAKELKDTKAQHSSETWASSNVVFEEAAEEKKEEPQPGSGDLHVNDAFKVSATVSEEKKESSEIALQVHDSSWDASTLPFARRTSNLAGLDDIDMFDTSSWAGGKDARFSDISLSKVATNVESEKQFVDFMVEEMKVRALTNDESRMLVEAKNNIEEAERAAEAEGQKLQKDDEPLVVGDASDDHEAVVEDTIPLEDRLMHYEKSEETDEQSDSGSFDSDEEVVNEDEFDDCAEAQVEYVHQEDVDLEGTFVGHSSADQVENFTLVPADCAPTLKFGAHGEVDEVRSPEIAMGGEPSKVFLSAPPPPPPGLPKTTKRSKSKSSSGIKIPLIAPPPEEKIKKWEDNKVRAQNYITAMRQELEKADSQALDSTAEYFQPFSQKVSYEVVATGTVDVGGVENTSEFSAPSEIVQLETSDSPEINMFLSGLSEDEAIKDKDFATEANVGHSEGAGSDRLARPIDAIGYEDDADPFLYLNQSIDMTDEGYDADRLGNDDEEDKQPSLFSTPSENNGNMKLGKVFQETSGQSGNFENVRIDHRFSDQLTDKVAPATSDTATSCEQKLESIVPSRSFEVRETQLQLNRAEVIIWFCKSVLKIAAPLSPGKDLSAVAIDILQDKSSLNALCQYVADSVNEVTTILRPGIGRSESVLSSFDESTVVSIENAMGSFDEHSDTMHDVNRPWMRPPVLTESSADFSPLVLAANTVSFFAVAAKLSMTASPFGDKNPFLTMIVESSLAHNQEMKKFKAAQQFLFEELDGRVDQLIRFAYEVKCSCDAELNKLGEVDEIDESQASSDGEDAPLCLRRHVVPDVHPSPFESSVNEVPRIVAVVLSFLGDPAAVCRIKMVNQFCHRLVSENEHILMQNAVRTGGIEMSVRPAFWMYVALQKCHNEDADNLFVGRDELSDKAKEGEEGKWHNVIERDVSRSFGNMPPHKTGAKLRNDSIVRALVTYGQNRTMKRGVRGGGEPFPTPELGPKGARKSRSRPTSPNCSSPPWEAKGENDGDSVSSEASETPTDTVSDWGGVSPKGSFAGSVNENEHDNTTEGHLSNSATDMSVEELALSGNSLTQDAKVDLRSKLSFVLHCLAATHEEIGYCQGMDYVVAHLLRILQETVKWKAANHSLAGIITTARSIHPPLEPVSPDNLLSIYKEVNDNLVVEEVVLRIMDALFMHYNLRHMYWPELRCLKTCCRVFERLIQIKLPVLADHFEHHELNVGLFALGWFQTLFLYLPSMPSATVCHIWDIWLVERSFKIFFRVGTAILFLSQPTLLNHDLEGMMIYLNTIPDSTLLRPDILIPCALNIKVTNRMLQELEAEVMQQPY